MTLSKINWDLEGWSDSDSVRLSEDMRKLYEQYAKTITISTPRDSNKSVVAMWAKMQLNSAYGYTGLKSIYYNNLCKEIVLPMKPVSKYQFTRAKWYVAEIPEYLQYHAKWSEMSKWLNEQFGPHDKNPNAWSRWIHDGWREIKFRDEADYSHFLLRWR